MKTVALNKLVGTFITGVCAGVILLTSLPASAQLDPDEALKSLVVADGLEISLFAAEPDLRNPTSIDVDAQGRVWVLEAANYRLFNQSIEDEKGDRIRILEDTNGDGSCDKATTFYQDPSLQAPLGIAVLGDRVYVCQSPDLFYLEDTDNDGVADKKTVILTGFKGVDHDHAIHGIQFGPDGFLYMSVGDQGLDVTDKSGDRVFTSRGGKYQAATVLRTDMEGMHLEILASNMRNPYEPTVDSFGNVYISDNDDDGNEQTRINYVFEGGDYGYWNEGTGGRRSGNKRLDEIHWNTDRAGTMPTMLKTGFGSPTGLMVYDGAALPDRLRGTLIHSDAGPGHIRSYRPVPDGAGFSAEMEVLVSSPEDSWFRPSDVTAGPDGSIFIADWYDAGVGGHRMVDANQGRIYRLTRKGESNKYLVPSVDLKSDAGLRKAFLSPNKAVRYLAHQSASQPSNADLLLNLFRGSDAIETARAFWLLVRNDEHRNAVIREALNDKRPEIRVMAVRGLSRFVPHSESDIAKAMSDSDPAVRRQVLLEMAFSNRSTQPQFASHGDAGTYDDWLATLQREYDGEDRFYREALGIAAEGHDNAAKRLLAEHEDAPWDSRVAGLALQYHTPDLFAPAMKTVEDDALPFGVRESALRAIDAIGGDDAGAYIVARAKDSGDQEVQALAFDLLTRNQGDTWRKAMNANDLDGYIGSEITNGKSTPETLAFIRELRREGLLPSLIENVTAASTTVLDRIEILKTIGSVISRGDFERYEECIGKLLPLLESENEEIHARTFGAITQTRGTHTRNVLGDYLVETNRPRTLRLRAVRTLSNTKLGSRKLLDLANDESIPDDILFNVADTLRSVKFESIRAEAIQLLPPEESRDGAPLPPLGQLLRKRGDSDNGKELFFNEEKASCSRCHSIASDGPDIGPNLGKIGEKLSRQAIFESILNPNAGISHEYQPWIIDTKSEEGLMGYIRFENARTLELIDSAGLTTSIPIADITAREKSTISVMPSGLAAGMTEQDLVDLVAFLNTLE